MLASDSSRLIVWSDYISVARAAIGGALYVCAYTISASYAATDCLELPAHFEAQSSSL